MNFMSSFGTRYSDTDALLPHWYNATVGSIILRLGVWLRWLRAMLYLRRVTTPWGSMSFLKMLHLDCKAGSWASPRCPAISLPGTLQHPEVLPEKRKFVYDLARSNGFSAWGVECCSLFDCSPALEGCDNESGRCELWQAGFAGCETMRSNFWEPRCKQSLFSLLCLQICECVDVFLGKSFWDSCFNWHWKERLIERLSNSNLQRLTNSDCFSKGRQEIHPDKDCKARGATQFAFRVFLA